MCNQTKEPDNTSPEAVLKNVTKELLRNDHITIIKEELGTDTGIIVKSVRAKSLYEYQCEHMVSLGIKIPKMSDMAGAHIINSILTQWLSRADKLGLVEKNTEARQRQPRDSGMDFVDVVKYTLSSRGLDVALKLQEHDDNKERFKQQSAISDVLKDNSSKSVTTARIALGVAAIVMISSISSAAINYIRLDKLEQKILSHDEIKLRIRSNEVRMMRLDSAGMITNPFNPVNQITPTSEGRTRPEPIKQ